MGFAGTVMNVLKGFICTAILFLPKELKTGGWAFMIFALILSCGLTIYCAQLLLEVKTHVNSTSYTDIGEQLFGFWGKWSVNICVACSQALFCCGYVYFIISNVHFIIQQITNTKTEGDEVYTAGICFVVFVLLCWVRKIELFAATSSLGNIIIMLVLLFVIIEGTTELVKGDRGGKGIGGGT